MILQATPDSVGGYKVPTDFATWMRFGRIWESDLLPAEKVRLTYRLLLRIEPYKQEIEQGEIERFLSACFGFYRAGQEPRPGNPAKERLIDWERDSAAIWGDFMVYAGIDLDTSKMHWWRFLALFESMPEDAHMSRIISLRSVDLSKIKDPDTRQTYADAKAQVALDYANDDWR